MTDRVDCRVFEDQLDSLVRGDLPDEARAVLHAHAAGCAECDALLRVQDHLHAPSLEALEARVPDGWVTSMWIDVHGALEARGETQPRNATRILRAARRGRRGRSGWRGRSGRWAVPLLSATVLVLLFTSVLGLRALRRSETREALLTAQLLQQQRRLVELDGPGPRWAPRGTGLTGGGDRLRALEAGGEVTVAELRAWLQDLPADTRLFSLPRTTGRFAAPRLVPGVWRDVLAALAAADDVTARDLLAVLDDLDVADGTSVPAGRLMDLLS